MQGDLFTKAVLTAIAVFLGVIAFDRQFPKQAKQEDRASGRIEMVSTGSGHSVWQVRDGMTRYCWFDRVKPRGSADPASELAVFCTAPVN